MPKPENLIGKGFDKRPQNINKKGRPRTLVAEIVNELKTEGIKPVRKTDVQDVYMMIINLPIPEITEIAKNPEKPALVRIIAKAILSNKGFEIVEKMLDRAHGKATNTIDVKDNKKQVFVIGGQRIEFE